MSHVEPPKPQQSATGQFIFWGALALVVVAVIWVRQGARRGDQGLNYPGVGHPLPALNLQGLSGGATDVDLKDLKGKVTLVNFWGTWCPPCRYELPHIVQLRKDLAARSDFRLLAVSCSGVEGESLERLREGTRQFLAQKQLELPTYADPDGVTRQAVGMTLGETDIPGYPTTILLDRGGIIRAIWVGYESGVEEEMRRAIEDELAKK
ncbi:MAG: TlpA family protein disulfide reductase [Planctomycetes bacterium]|nr:TlpA family protein disulfide reductase [Planctomycetota bacterium]